MALGNLGLRLAETGQQQAALAATQEAVTIYYLLAEGRFLAVVATPDCFGGGDGSSLAMVAGQLCCSG
jgi:hypothetical protein